MATVPSFYCTFPLHLQENGGQGPETKLIAREIKH